MTVAPEDQRLAQLVQMIAPQSKLAGTWPLNGGMSATMTALAFEDATGQAHRIVVRRPGASTLRRNPNAAADEFKLLQLTHAAGLATPKPYCLDQSGTIFATPYLVIEYVTGQPEFVPANLADFTLQAATHLAEIHTVDCTKLDLSFLPQQVQGFADNFGEQPTSIDQTLEEARIRATLAAVWPLPSRNIPALLHGDFWPGNLLWQAEQLVAVIDWEDAQIGDPLMDLAISRLDILCLFGVEALHSFTQHYQARLALDYTHLPYWDLYAALRLVRMAGADFAAWATFFPRFGRADITEQTLIDHYRFFVAQAFAKLKYKSAYHARIHNNE